MDRIQIHKIFTRQFFVLWFRHQEIDFLGYFDGSYVFSINLPLPQKLAWCDASITSVNPKTPKP